MLVSSSEGFCLEGLVAAILLRAAMIAVVGLIVAVLGLRFELCFTIFVCEFGIAVGLSSRVKRYNKDLALAFLGWYDDLPR